VNEEAQTAAPSGPNSPPPRISELVRRRAEARAGHDWPAADALKAEIEAAGWSVVDRGGQSTVRRTSPVSVEVEGEVRYGSAADVPSRLETPAEAPWTVAVVAGEAPDRVSRLLAGLRAHAPAGTHVVVVLNDPSEAQVTALAPGVADREPVAGREPEVLRTAVRLGHAAALNVALRRAAGELVLLADGTAIPTGDALTPLAGALSDQQVAVAGAFGLTSAEPGGLRPRALERTSSGEVEALAWGWLAFRRSDYVELGPLDERFVTPAWLDVWLSLRLRAGADSEWVQEAEPPIEGAGGSEEEADAGEPANALEPPIGLDLPAPRRAVCLALPLEGGGEPWPPERTRLNRRNMYRVLRRFGWRADLFRTRADR
jgi:hypothetical protein